jgi:nitroreductase
VELGDAIRQRRTIRKFKKVPVPRDVLERVLELALWAPSAGDEHQYELVVISGDLRAAAQQAVVDVIDDIRRDCAREFARDPRLAQRVADFYLDFGGAPVLVFAYAGKLADGRDDNFGISVALQNVFLGAHEAGLGTAWAGLPSVNAVERSIGLDGTGKSLVGIVPVGYPDEAPASSPRKQGRIRWLS